MTDAEYPKIADYAVCFLDLLGQRAELRGQSVLPEVADEKEVDELARKIKSTVGMVGLLQTHAKRVLDGLKSLFTAANRAPDPALERLLERTGLEDMKLQRWSDGVVIFSVVRPDTGPENVIRLLHLIYMAGINCLIGLSRGYAIRGGIEIGWAGELRPGELCGSAIARAYELESEVAQYPRIVVGPVVVQRLTEMQQNQSRDPEWATGRAAAQLALELLALDVDGFRVVDYLGPRFRQCAAKPMHQSLIEDAEQFVRSQLDQHRRERNTKLAFRYKLLLSYFETSKPTEA